MLRKLRIKFVALIMGVAAVLLTAVCVAACAIDYHQSVDVVAAVLDRAIAHAADEEHLPLEGALAPEGTSLLDGPLPSAPPNGERSGSASEAAPPLIGGPEPEPSIPVAVYRMDAGALQLIPTRATAYLSDETLAAAEGALAAAPEGTRNLGSLGLFYEKRAVRGITYVALVEDAYVNGWQRLALVLAGIQLAALGILLVISVRFSQWALEPVQRAWRQQRQFVADASHDLKTPITVILANTAIMLEEPERSVASQRQWVESTREEAESMRSMVNDMLALARFDEAEGRDATRRDRTTDADAAAEATAEDVRSCDLARIATAELLQFESVAYERELTLTGDIAENVIVHAPEESMRRLLQILLDNACKYTDEKGSVAMRVHAANDAAVLAVSNTGKPIPPEQIESIFDRFYRADAARTSHEGHGLGLAIARSIVHECHGTLAATSTEGSTSDGLTTFTAHIPLA